MSHIPDTVMMQPPMNQNVLVSDSCGGDPGKVMARIPAVNNTRPNSFLIMTYQPFLPSTTAPAPTSAMLIPNQNMSALFQLLTEAPLKIATLNPQATSATPARKRITGVPGTAT